MTKYPIFIVAVIGGVLSQCLSLSAEEIDKPATFSALNASSLWQASLTLTDESVFSFSEPVAEPLFFTWIETTEPDAEVPEVVVNPGRDSAFASGSSAAIGEGPSKNVLRDDSAKEIIDQQRKPFFDHFGGEVDYLYGKSGGKYGVEIQRGAVIGELGNDMIHITVGAAYEERSGNFRTRR